MIRPDLGTMIAVVTTDADVPAGLLRELLADAAAASFNRITVDGSESTSDSLFALAGGASGVAVGEPEAGAFGAALTGVCQELALAMVRDGEGARRVAPTRCPVRAPTTRPGGRRGGWPRTSSSAAPSRRRPQLGPHLRRARRRRRGARPRPAGHRHRRRAADDGGQPGAAERRRRRAAAAEEVVYAIDLGCGDGTATVWGSDLGYEYVRMNAEYTT